MNKKYLSVYVYKNVEFGDCTNNGVSAQNKKFAVICRDGNLTEEHCLEHDYTILDIESFNGLMRAKPRGENRWCMFGGNFIYCSDSRFREISPYPIPIHDRIE